MLQVTFFTLQSICTTSYSPNLLPTLPVLSPQILVYQILIHLRANTEFFLLLSVKTWSRPSLSLHSILFVLSHPFFYLWPILTTLPSRNSIRTYKFFTCVPYTLSHFYMEIKFQHQCLWLWKHCCQKLTFSIFQTLHSLN